MPVYYGSPAPGRLRLPTNVCQMNQHATTWIHNKEGLQEEKECLGKSISNCGPHGVSPSGPHKQTGGGSLQALCPPWPVSPPPQGQSPKIHKVCCETERDTAITVTNKITQCLLCWPCPGTPSGVWWPQGEHNYFVLSPSPTNSVRQKNDVTSPGIDQPPVCCVILWLSPMLSDQRVQLTESRLK